MKKATLMLTAMALLVCATVAQAAFPADSSEKMVFVDKGDGRDCCANHDRDQNHGPHQGFCTEICQGREGCHKGGMKDVIDRDQCCLKCIVFEHCDECDKTYYCNGICDECGEPCEVYEYCPSCGAKYLCEHADARCDYCGKDCYCFQKCDKCGHNHYFNGYCDECASRCQYVRCCHNLCDMQTHEPSENCKEQAPGCNKMPEKCDSCMNNENYAKNEPADQAGSPVLVEVYPMAQGESAASMIQAASLDN